MLINWHLKNKTKQNECQIKTWFVRAFVSVTNIGSLQVVKEEDIVMMMIVKMVIPTMMPKRTRT
jgi:hypothetical protein